VPLGDHQIRDGQELPEFSGATMLSSLFENETPPVIRFRESRPSTPGCSGRGLRSRTTRSARPIPNRLNGVTA
jgi:hypothetical protein